MRASELALVMLSVMEAEEDTMTCCQNDAQVYQEQTCSLNAAQIYQVHAQKVPSRLLHSPADNVQEASAGRFQDASFWGMYSRGPQPRGHFQDASCSGFSGCYQ